VELLSLRRRASLYSSACANLLRALAAGVIALAPALVMAQDRAVEYAVKATYLYKFAPFVEWPAGTFASAADPLVLCIVGTGPVGDLAAEATSGQSVAGRSITVIRMPGPPPRGTRCQIMYVAGPRSSQVRAALDSVKGTSVLTVTDSAPEAAVRGIINFVIVENRVRFEIDLTAAAENHLVISSKLLSLAVGIHQQP